MEKEKLKTLKDIEKEVKHDLCSGFCSLTEECFYRNWNKVRAEAVKWYKSFNRPMNDIDIGIRVFIRTFFNLIQEDLK